jgi:hypothetical protein
MGRGRVTSSKCIAGYGWREKNVGDEADIIRSKSYDAVSFQCLL